MNAPLDTDVFNKAEELLKSGQFTSGIGLLVSFFKTNPGHQEAIRLILQIANSFADKKQSTELLNYSIKQGITTPLIQYELGAAHLSVGSYPEAIKVFNEVLQINPNHFEALHDMGVAYALCGKTEEALDKFHRAVAIFDQSADLFYNLGRLYDEQFNLNRAIEFYQKAVNLDPQYTQAWINLGIDLSVYKKYPEALACFERAYSQNPHLDFLFGDCIYTRMRMCNWEGIDELFNQIEFAINRGQKIISPFTVSAKMDSPELLQKSASIYSSAKYPSSTSSATLRGNLSQKIRIGYYSPDFYDHPVSFLMAELIELHDRKQFEVYAFSFGKESNDPMRKRLMSSFDHFIDVRNNTPEEIVALSRSIGIDIAVDLCGFTENARTEIFALRAAPIQISYLGFLGTMGTDFIDYLIADLVIIPLELRQFYKEKIIYLPSYQVNDTQRAPSSRIFHRAELGLEEHQFVFCNLNSTYKITEHIFNSWLQILNAVEDSAFVLYGENICAIENLRSYAAKRGINQNRLIFLNHLPREEYLARYQIVDLFLDTYPYNAGTTASDALWMGVPVITLQGKTFSSRVASSLLANVNLPELIHQDIESYQKQAIELASKPEEFKALKEKLCTSRKGAQLFNIRLFVANLEAALNKALSINSKGALPEDINVNISQHI